MVVAHQPDTALFVDDDQLIVDIYSRKFADMGIDADFAMTGEAALELLRAGQTPAMIIIDYTMPGMNGIDLVDAIHEEHLAPDATLVLLSNQTEEELAAKSKAAHIDEYLVKATLTPTEVLQKSIAVYAAGHSN